MLPFFHILQNISLEEQHGHKKNLVLYFQIHTVSPEFKMLSFLWHISGSHLDDIQISQKNINIWKA